MSQIVDSAKNDFYDRFAELVEQLSNVTFDGGLRWRQINDSVFVTGNESFSFQITKEPFVPSSPRGKSATYQLVIRDQSGDTVLETERSKPEFEAYMASLFNAVETSILNQKADRVSAVLASLQKAS